MPTTTHHVLVMHWRRQGTVNIYKGPEQWGQLNPKWETCETGSHQSPIDLRDGKVEVLSQLGKLNRTYKPAPAVIRNRGHDIMVQWTGDAGGIIINGTEYKLKQCHWHTPAEHRVLGQSFNMELHMVHNNSQGQVAVVGILYVFGHPDAFLEKFLPRDLNSVSEEGTDLGVVNPRDIKLGSRKYFRYIGSLTVPPCTEGVIWTVLKKVRTVSREQVRALRNAVHDVITELMDSKRKYSYANLFNLEPLMNFQLPKQDEDFDYYGNSSQDESRGSRGEHVNGIMSERALKKKKRRSAGSSDEEETGSYSPYISEERAGTTVMKNSVGLKDQKLTNDSRGGLHKLESTSDFLNGSNSQKLGNYPEADFGLQYGAARPNLEPAFLDIGDGITYRIPLPYEKLSSSLNLPSMSDIRVEEFYLKGTLDLGSLAAMMASDSRFQQRISSGMGDSKPQYESLQAKLKAQQANNCMENFCLKISEAALRSNGIPEGAAGGIRRSILSDGGILQVYYVKVLEKGDTYEIIERGLPKKPKVKKDPSVIERKKWKRLVKMKVSRSLKLMRSAAIRTRRLARDMLVFWKRVDKEMAEVRKREEKEAAEALKREQELREAKRQQQRLNFLLSQTELYSHFMQNKSSQPSELTVGEEKSIDQEMLLSSSEARLEEEDPEDAELRREALRAAHDAVSKQKMMTSAFDNECLKLRLASDAEAALQDASVTESTMPVASTVQTPELFKGSLKEYQLKGLQWLVNCYEQGLNGILADEMGLGKTIQAMAFLAHLAEEKNIWGPFLVVAPASVLSNWADEISRFCPDLKTLPYWGGLQERTVLRKNINPKRLYRSYQLLVSDERYFRRVKWQYMVLDEAQAIKSSNRIESHAEHGGTLNEHQLNRLHAILKPFMLRRVKKDVITELTGKTEIMVHCKLSSRQQAFYQAIKNKISLAELFDGNRGHLNEKKILNLMNIVIQLRKVCNHPELFERNEGSSFFHFGEIPNSLLPSPFGELDDIFYSGGRNPITYEIPKLVYQEVVDGSKIQYSESGEWLSRGSLEKLFNIFSPENIYYSTRQQDYILDGHSGQSGTRLDSLALLIYRQFLDEILDLLMESNDDDIYCAHIGKEKARAVTRMLLLPSKSETNLLRRKLATGPVDAPFEALIMPYEDRLLSDINILHSVYSFIPRTRAPPINAHCSDRNFAYKMTEEWHHPWLKRLLIGFARTSDCNGPRKPVGTHHLIQEIDAELPVSQPALQLTYKIFGSCPPMQPFDPAKMLTDSGKLQTLDILLKRLRAGNHRVLLFAQMTRMLNILEDYMNYRKYRYLRLDGSSTIMDRRDMVKDFQHRSDIFVFLLSTRAGGLGINLTAADTVIFYESDWNPTLDLQAMDRAHRLGQTKDVTVYRLICKETVEEKILQRASQKNTVQQLVMTGGHVQGDLLAPEDVVSLLIDDTQLEQKLKEVSQQAKDRQKKKGGSKGIRIDAEGGASLEDLTNPELLQDNDYEPPDPDKAKSSSKKVIISMLPSTMNFLM
ncbi:hypothetical protein DH2020_013951 [Rehmannia glutinosa]|uniref:Chromatin-remodeling ATPase INO80 n=1 Tax=Rehmannia glutinosa TaxID=99300 RepID=A0ABR0WWG4_REHGL